MIKLHGIEQSSLIIQPKVDILNYYLNITE
jgi:hypothetical protein